MRSWISQNIKGDKFTWAIIMVFAFMSFLAVYSASTNLVYVVGSGTTFGHFLKHGVLMLIGFVILFFVHKMPYRFFRPISIIGLFVVIPLLLITLLGGQTIDGANASRWIQVPGIGLSFQPSTLASVTLMVYVASYLAKYYNNKPTFKATLIELWMPVLVIVGLIIPANLSTALLLFFSVMLLAFIGRHPLSYLFQIIGLGLVLMVFFLLVAKAFPEAMPNRVDTWVSRIEAFAGKGDAEDNYQIERAKMAIAKGGLLGEGAGKSVMKNFLPQSSSDFIYAIIVEEYGSFGALTVMVFYLFLLLRIVIISQRAKTIFGQLLVLGVGFPIIVQALVNMGVAVELFPVTGQNLPLISSGGTSIWMTCLALGLILSVSATKTEDAVAMDDDDSVEELAEEILEGLQKENIQTT